MPLDHVQEYDSDEDEDDLAYQPWFYENIDRREVKLLLKGSGANHRRPSALVERFESPGTPSTACQLDGAFLVRNSGEGGYTLSFM